jgi:serine phosphatase RsbU (regulator of sigma subunit)
VTAAPSGADFARLSALIARQRDQLRLAASQAATRSVIDLARGILMERLGCTAAEAQAQLEHLSTEASVGVAELASQITGVSASGLAGAAGPGPARAAQAGPDGGSLAAAHHRVLAAAAMETAPDAAAMAAAVLEEALAPAGAVAVALWRAEPDGGLELAGASGLPAADASRWRRIHPDMDTLPQRAAGAGAETWWPDGPPAGTAVPVPGYWAGGARAVLPLPGPGLSVGALEVCWPGPLGEFPVPLRRHLRSLADLCAQALGVRLADGSLAPDDRAAQAFGLLDSLLGSALYARAVRDGAGQVSDFQVSYLSAGFADPAGRDRSVILGGPLLEAYPAAALDGGLFDRARQVLASGQPQQLSGEIIATPVGNGLAAPVVDVRIARLYDGVVITWQRSDQVQRLGALLEQAQRLGRVGGWEENLLTGDVLWTEPTFALFGQPPGAPVPVADLDGRVPADDLPVVRGFRDTLLRDKREASAAFRVIRADDESIRQMRAFAVPITDQAGTLVGVRGAYQDISADYHTQVAFAATRDALADTAEWAQEEHRLALRLQQAITPRSAEPANLAGLEVATRYRPAGPGNLVSGDWYDTVRLPGGDVLLVVGDIAGHGIDAVTGMVALRNCLRGLAITGAGPAALLGWLNEVACHLTDGIIGTVVCGIYHPPARTLRWARAGHLPPVLVRGGAARSLDRAAGVLVGADPRAGYHEVTTELQPGDILVMFTDGLIERHDESIDDSLAGLLELASQPVSDIAKFADQLISGSRPDTSDDACLVAVHVR